MPWLMKLVIAAIFLSMFALAYSIVTMPPQSSIVETRNEHLVWSSPGCKVWQVVIKNEWGNYVLFITTRARKETPLRQADYPTCRVTTE